MFKKKEGLLLAGLVCIFFAIIFKYSFDETGLTDFFQGLFMGLSVVFNISYLIKCRRNKGINFYSEKDGNIVFYVCKDCRN